MLCGMLERGIKPDVILSADTGAEMPHSYRMLETMQAKVCEWWAMEIVVVRKLRAGIFEGIDGECMRGHKLPALAYGSRAAIMQRRNSLMSASSWIIGTPPARRSSRAGTASRTRGRSPAPGSTSRWCATCCAARPR